MNYEQAINELRAVNYCNSQIIRLNTEIELLRYQMTGLAHSGGPVLTKKQQRSQLPMPTSNHEHRPPEWTLAAIEKREDAIRVGRARILGCRWIESDKLNDEDRQILIELHLLRKRGEDVAEEHNQSRSSMYNRLKRKISKI